jgi:predicted  nucleic acid-binding Zn-ribbon protein
MKRKISPSQLRKIVLLEARKLQKESLSGKVEDTSKVKAEEYEAGQEATTLEKDLDHIKALKIKESLLNRQHKKLVREMRRLQEAKRKLRKKIVKNI